MCPGNQVETVSRWGGLVLVPDIPGGSSNLEIENWLLDLATGGLGVSLVGSTRADLEEVWVFPNFLPLQGRTV